MTISPEFSLGDRPFIVWWGRRDAPAGATLGAAAMRPVSPAVRPKVRAMRTFRVKHITPGSDASQGLQNALWSLENYTSDGVNLHQSNIRGAPLLVAEGFWTVRLSGNWRTRMRRN